MQNDKPKTRTLLRRRRKAQNWLKNFQRTEAIVDQKLKRAFRQSSNLEWRVISSFEKRTKWSLKKRSRLFWW